MPRATNGIFVNPENDRTILFCDMEKRGDRTPFSFAKTMLPDLHLPVIHIHVGQVTALILPVEEHSLKALWKSLGVSRL